MKRIDTPTADPNLFGPGLAGYDDLAGVAGTELDASSLNNTQETLCRAITGQNLLLDGANFDQLTDAINIWSTFNAIGVAPGGTFTMVTASTFIVETGSTIQVDSGGTISALLGSTVDLLGNVTIGTTGANTLTVDATTQLNENLTVAASKDVNLLGNVTAGTSGADTLTVDATTLINENVTLAAAKDLTLASDGTLTAGTLDAIDSTGETLTGALKFYDSTTVPSVDDELRVRNGNLLMRREGQTLSVMVPTENFDTTFTSAGNGYATVLQVTRALDADETAVVEVKCWAYRNGASVNTMDWRVRSSLIVANVFEDGVIMGNGATNKKVIHSRFPFIPSVLEGALSGMGIHVFDLQIDRNEAAVQEVTALEIWLTVRSGVQL